MSVSGREPALVMAVAASVSLVLAPCRGTPLALPVDLAFALIVAASLGFASFGNTWLHRRSALWTLAVFATLMQVAVPFLGWDRIPMAGPILLLAPVALLSLGVAASVALGHLPQGARRRRALALLTVVAISAAGWSLVERTRIRQLRWGATSVSVQALRAIETRLHDGREPGPSLRDGWGWPIRLETLPDGFRITAPGANGHFESLAERGQIASWEDDLVVGRGQRWHRWPPLANGSSTPDPEPWRDWRTPRWWH